MYHLNNKITAVCTAENQNIDFEDNDAIAFGLHKLAVRFPNEILVWCHWHLKNNLNIERINSLFHHKKLLFSYNPSKGTFLGKAIGYVEESPFIKVNQSVTFPTWQMSSQVGAVHAEVLITLKDNLSFEKDFD